MRAVWSQKSFAAKVQNFAFSHRPTSVDLSQQNSGSQDIPIQASSQYTDLSYHALISTNHCAML